MNFRLKRAPLFRGPFKRASTAYAIRAMTGVSAVILLSLSSVLTAPPLPMNLLDKDGLAQRTLQATSIRMWTKARDERGKRCLRLVIYDKPVKTGSTALAKGLAGYLSSTSRPSRVCRTNGIQNCLQLAQAVCEDVTPWQYFQSLLGHIRVSNESQITCLKERGYYAVTSIRDPESRWRSSFLYNRMMKASHFGIPWNVSFSEYVDKYPRCSLLHYYDGLGTRCDEAKMSMEERISRVVDRYDEVIDLQEEAVGPLHKKVMPFLKIQNKSSRPADSGEDALDPSFLKEEMMLYEALRGKIGKRVEESRMPC